MFAHLVTQYVVSAWCSGGVGASSKWWAGRDNLIRLLDPDMFGNQDAILFIPCTHLLVLSVSWRNILDA